MTSSQKFSVSLLISVLAFSVFSVLALSGQFKVVEAKFYQPAVRRPIEQKVNELVEQEKQYNQILASRFSAFAGDSAVLTFTKKSPSPEEKKAQEISCGRLISSSPYLLGIRVIEAGGKSIYYSSFETDKKPRSDLNIKNYEDYDKVVSQSDELKFELIKCPSDKKYSVYYDVQRRRSVYSVPLYGKGNDGQAINCVIVFYCEPQDFIRYLYSKNIISRLDF